MASFLYTPEPDEQIVIVKPRGEYWLLKELQELVGGYIEVVRTIDGRFMVINEKGKLHRLPLNKQATRVYQHGLVDPIVGPALIVDTRKELDE